MIEWLQQGWVYLLALSAGLAALLSLIKSVNEIKTMINKPNEIQNAKIKELEDKIVEQQKVIEKIPAVEEAMAEHNKEIDDKVAKLMEAMVCLLRDKINHYFEKGAEQGYLTTADYKIVTAFAKAYFALGGNDIVHGEMDYINNLPIKAKN